MNYNMNGHIMTFRDIIINDYEEVKYLLEHVRNDINKIKLMDFVDACSLINNNHRIICCIYHDIETGTDTLVAIGTILFYKKIFHNCDVVGYIEDVIVHEKNVLTPVDIQYHANNDTPKQLNFSDYDIRNMMIEYLINIAKENSAYKVILSCNEYDVSLYEKY